MLKMITEEEGKASEDDDESCKGTTCDEEDSKGGVSPMAAYSNPLHPSKRTSLGDRQ